MQNINETLVLMEGTDGKPVGSDIDPSTGHFYRCKKAAHMSCMEEHDPSAASMLMIHSNPQEDIFITDPELEKECTVCHGPILRELPKPDYDADTRLILERFDKCVIERAKLNGYGDITEELKMMSSDDEKFLGIQNGLSSMKQLSCGQKGCIWTVTTNMDDAVFDDDHEYDPCGAPY